MHITSSNLSTYLFSMYSTQKLIARGDVTGFIPLLQKDFGGPNDCTLTSIAAIINHATGNTHNVDKIYTQVEAVAQNNFYEINGNGTMPLAIRTIFNNAIKPYSKRTSCVRYGKDIGYGYDFIKEQIDNNNPILLSLHKDGLGYYENHSVTIIGYREYSHHKLIKIYDNWSKQPSYLDYDNLSTISSLHCLCGNKQLLLDFLWSIVRSLFGKK